MNKTIMPASIRSLHLEIQFNDQLLSCGTGFIIKHSNKYYLITNRHIVTGRNNITGEILSPHGSIPNRIAIWHHIKGYLGQWVKLIEPVLDHINNPLWFEHPLLKEKADVVALELSQTDNIDFYPYTLEDNNACDELSPTDTVSVVGFPFGLASSGKLAIWATGFIASESALPYDNLPVFLIDCRTRKGQSGSPVIFHRNPGSYNSPQGLVLNKSPVTKLLGIYSGRIREDSDLGMVWKVEIIKELVRPLL